MRTQRLGVLLNPCRSARHASPPPVGRNPQTPLRSEFLRKRARRPVLAQDIACSTLFVPLVLSFVLCVWENVENHVNGARLLCDASQHSHSVTLATILTEATPVFLLVREAADFSTITGPAMSARISRCITEIPTCDVEVRTLSFVQASRRVDVPNRSC